MKNIFIAFGITISSISLIYCYTEPGTVWEMNRAALPATLSNGNRGGGCWNASIGSGGGVDYSTWITPLTFGGITTLGADPSVLLATSAAADWKGNCVVLTGGSNLWLGHPWYQVTQVVPGVSFTLTATTGPSVSVATGIVVDGSMNLGGAISGNGANFPTANNTENGLINALTSSNTLFVKSSGTYNWATITPILSIFNNSTITYITGYQNFRGDDPSPFGVSTAAPNIAVGGATILLPTSCMIKNLFIAGTGTSLVTAGFNDVLKNVRIENNSNNVNRSALSNNSNGGQYYENVELVSQFGPAQTLGIQVNLIVMNGGYIHDSSTGILHAINQQGGNIVVINSVFANNKNGAIVHGGTGQLNRMSFHNNTFLGFDNIQVSTIVTFLSTAGVNFTNNIFAGGWSAFESRGMPVGQNPNFNNSYFNFATTFSGRNVGYENYFDTITAWGVNPQFVNSTEIFGTTATVSASTVLRMDQGGMFDNAGITDNLDYVIIHGGTGATLGSYKIIGHSSFTVTVNQTIGTSATADKTWTIRTGKNFRIGTNLKARGAPSSMNVSSTTAFIDLGGVQRQEQGTSATTAIGIIGN